MVCRNWPAETGPHHCLSLKNFIQRFPGYVPLGASVPHRKGNSMGGSSLFNIGSKTNDYKGVTKDKVSA